MTIPDEYVWRTRVATYQADSNRQLKLSAQLKLQQEAGELHLEPVGLGFEGLQRQGMVFVITRLATRIYRAPRACEDIVLKTWHRDTRGVQFYRCYSFSDAAGNILVESTTAFALLDISETGSAGGGEHKLLRPAAFDKFGIGAHPEHVHVNGCTDPGKILLPDMADAGTRRIYWSDTDWNGHLNNAVYADLLCDFMPGGMQGRCFTDVRIQFTGEALEGDELRMRHGEKGGVCYVAGQHGRGRCFEASATVK